MALAGFTPQEVRLLREMLKSFRGSSRPNLPREFPEDEHSKAPETFVAYPQTSDGIPALLPAIDPGTGTWNDAEPGKADCDIYRIVDDGAPGDPKLEQISGVEKVVYNLTQNPIDQDYIAITRTKSGKWIVIVPAEKAIRMVHGTLVGNDPDESGTGSPPRGLLPGDTTFFIDNVVVIYGDSPVSAETGTGTSDELLIHNVHSWEADIGARVVAVYCVDEDRWEAIQITCPA